MSLSVSETFFQKHWFHPGLCFRGNSYILFCHRVGYFVISEICFRMFWLQNRLIFPCLITKHRVSYPAFLSGWSCMALCPSWNLSASLGEIFSLLTASSLGPLFQQQTQVGCVTLAFAIHIISVIIRVILVVSDCHSYLPPCVKIFLSVCMIVISPICCSDCAGHLQWAEGRRGPVCLAFWGECP